MIDVVYTGDIRHAQKVRAKNHNKLLKKLDCKVSEFYYGTKRGEKDFFGCPFDRGGKDAYWRWDNLRRGQGGGVQVWQFANAVRLTKNPIIIRLRNDVWFGEGSIKVIMSEIKKIEDGENDICFLGSNWLEGAMGAEYEISNKFKRVEDFVIIARREALKKYDDLMSELQTLVRPNSLRSGNKCFKYIGLSNTKQLKVLCRIYLIRKTYEYANYPHDKQVCYDYIMSYCKNPSSLDKMWPAIEWIDSYEPWQNINYEKEKQWRLDFYIQAKKDSKK